MEPRAPIRLIALDIDGTLLTPQRQISPRTHEAIEEAKRAGIIVTLATARRYTNSQHFATQLGLDIPMITYDGGLIVQHPTGEILHTRTLSSTQTRQAIELLVRHKLQPVLQRLHGEREETLSGHIDFDNPGIEGYFKVFPEVARMEYYDLGVSLPAPFRVVSFATEEAIREVIPALRTLQCTWGYLQLGSYGSAELTIMPEGCSKATGVEILARQLGIHMEEVMAIGDNTNDSEMLQAVGWGVAMGQAPEEVKAVARAVTASNAEDGVALAIERYALRRSDTVLSNSRKR